VKGYATFLLISTPFEINSDADANMEYNSTQINNYQCGHLDVFGHGTSVTGIACGNGKKTGNGVPSNTYKGVAPEANMIIYDLVYEENLSTGKILDGVEYIFQKAGALNKPCVINLSSGSLKGPKDGTSPYEMALSDAGFYSGRAVVVSAGNYSYVDPKPLVKGAKWHAIRNSYSYPSIQDTVEIFVASDSMAQPQGSDEHIAIQIWYPAGQDFHVGLLSPSGDSCGHWGPIAEMHGPVRQSPNPLDLLESIMKTMI